MTDGTIIADGSLVVGKPGDKPLDFLRLDLKNVRVSSYQLRPATDGSNALLEEFTLSFEQVAMEYRSQKADGTLDSPVVFQGAQVAVVITRSFVLDASGEGEPTANGCPTASA